VRPRSLRGRERMVVCQSLEVIQTVTSATVEKMQDVREINSSDQSGMKVIVRRLVRLGG